MYIPSVTKLNYISGLQTLFSSTAYYARLEQESRRDDYWQDTLDPDGNLRNIQNEQEIWTKNNSELLNFLKEVILQNPIKNIVDFGSGPGYLLSYLKRLNIPGVQLIGVEESVIGKSISNASGLTIEDTLEDIPAESMDLVVANHVIEHLEDPVFYIKEIKRIVKRNGFVIVGTPDFLSPSAFLFRERYRMLHEPSHISLFSSDSLLRLLRDNDFAIKEIRYPFWDSPYFNQDTFQKILAHNQVPVSPPFPGNFILVSCQNKNL
jgi:SAM-dependent methyltransferase